MIWLMEILPKTTLSLTRYYAIKQLILLKIQNVMDINVDMLQCFSGLYLFYKKPLATNKETGINPDVGSQNQQLLE